MAVTSPIMRDGLYYGSIEANHAKLILDTIGKPVIPELQNMIFDFPADLIERSIDEGKSIRNILKEEGTDHTKYLGKLKDFQTVGTGFMYVSPRSILGDGVGAGKTVEISALLNLLKQQQQMSRFVMLVEKTATGQTRCELIRFTGMNVVYVPSEKPKLLKMIKNTDWSTVDGIVGSHSLLTSDTFSKFLSLNLREDGINKFADTVILDESSVVKNSNTKVFRYTKGILDTCNRVHLLNATTFETSIMDIYNQVDLLDDSMMPKPWRIEKEYCNFVRDSYWKTMDVRSSDGRLIDRKPQIQFRRKRASYKNQEQFRKSLKLVYFGRSAKEVGIESEMAYKVYEIEPTANQLKAIKAHGRYNEILNCPSLVEEAGLVTNKHNVPKINRLVELVQTEFDQQSVMVYCFHLKAQEAIKKELEAVGKRPVILNGKTEAMDRYRIQREFNEGKYDVIITNVVKSLNLHGADVCIFYSVLGNPSRSIQVAGRIDRHVDDRMKTFVLLLYKGTDEYKLFADLAGQRSKDAKDLTIDAKNVVDNFIEELFKQEDA